MIKKHAKDVWIVHLKPMVILPGGHKTRPHTVKCYRQGCRRVKRGYLTAHRSELGGGAFYDKRGRLLADLREQDFACKEHGIADGSAPFLFRDKEKS
jgi:hypothetical protein